MQRKAPSIAATRIFEALPREVLQEVLRLLKPRHKASLRLVCSHWRFRFSQEVTSVTLLVSDSFSFQQWGDAAKRAAVVFPHVEQVVLRWTVPQYRKADAGKYGQILRILASAFPHLTQLHIRGRILPFAIRNAVVEGLPELPRLKALQLDCWESSPGSFSKALKGLPNLTILRLTTGDTICTGFLQAFCRNKLLGLTCLELRGTFVDTALPFQLCSALTSLKKLALSAPEMSLYNNAMGIQQHVVKLGSLPLLEHLEINIGEPSLDLLPPPSGFPSLRSLRYVGIHDSHTLQWLAQLTQLSSLSLQLRRRSSSPVSSSHSLACLQNLKLKEPELQALCVLSKVSHLSLDISHASRLSLAPLLSLRNLRHFTLSWQAMLLGSKGEAMRRIAQISTLTSLEVLPQSLTPLGWNAIPGPTSGFVDALSQLTGLTEMRRLKLRLSVWPSQLLEDCLDVDERTGQPLKPTVAGPSLAPLPPFHRSRPQPPPLSLQDSSSDSEPPESSSVPNTPHVQDTGRSLSLLASATPASTPLSAAASGGAAASPKSDQYSSGRVAGTLALGEREPEAAVAPANKSAGRSLHTSTAACLASSSMPAWAGAPANNSAASSSHTAPPGPPPASSLGFRGSGFGFLGSGLGFGRSAAGSGVAGSGVGAPGLGLKGSAASSSFGQLRMALGAGGVSPEQGLMMAADADEEDGSGVPLHIFRDNDPKSCVVDNRLLYLFLQHMPHLTHLDVRPNAFCPAARKAVLQVPWLQLDC